MIAALLLMLAAAGPSGGASSPAQDDIRFVKFGGFRVYQYRSDAKTETVNFRKGLSCMLEASTSRPFGEYAQNRWSEEDKLILIQPKNGFQSACAFPGFDKHGLPKNLPKFRIAAIALAGPEVTELFKRPFPGYDGWPVPPGAERKKSSKPRGDAVQRLGLVCWPGEAKEVWPNKASVAELSKNYCELWLLPFQTVGAELEPKLDGDSMLVAGGPIGFSRFQWAGSLDEPSLVALQLGEAVAPAAARPDAGVAPDVPDAGVRPAVPDPVITETPPAPPPAPVVAAGPCNMKELDEQLRQAKPDYRAQLYARFLEWCGQLGLTVKVDEAGRVTTAHLDVGRKQKLDILRAALERRIGCQLPIEGERE